MALTYTTYDAFVAYADWDTTSDNQADVEKELERAERDVDNIIFGTKGAGPNGLKWPVVSLAGWAADALSRAVCAQAEYRLTMGRDFMVRGQFSEMTTPDSTVKGKLPRIGPKVRDELTGSGLLVGMTRLTQPVGRVGAPPVPRYLEQ